VTIKRPTFKDKRWLCDVTLHSSMSQSHDLFKRSWSCIS